MKKTRREIIEKMQAHSVCTITRKISLVFREIVPEWHLMSPKHGQDPADISGTSGHLILWYVFSSLIQERLTACKKQMSVLNKLIHGKRTHCMDVKNSVLW